MPLTRWRAGASKEELAKSPFLEKLLQKGLEVVFMTDAIDEYVMSHLTEYDDAKFQNASKDNLKLGKDDKKAAKALKARAGPCISCPGRRSTARGPFQGCTRSRMHASRRGRAQGAARGAQRARLVTRVWVPGAGRVQGAGRVVEGAAGPGGDRGPRVRPPGHLARHRGHQPVRLERQHGAHHEGAGARPDPQGAASLLGVAWPALLHSRSASCRATRRGQGMLWMRAGGCQLLVCKRLGLRNGAVRDR